MKTYQIYDGENSALYSDDVIIEAKTGKDAILQHLKNTGRNYTIKRSKDNDVLFKAEPFYEKNGQKYKNGNVVWYKKEIIKN